MEDEDMDLSYSTEHIDQLLQCAICLDRYTQPKILPCQHTFCETPCLEGLVNGLYRTLKCPECRAEHRVPYQGISAFPNNLTIKNFLDLPTRRRRRVSGGAGAGDGAGESSSVRGADGGAVGGVGICSTGAYGAAGYSRAIEPEPPTAAASRSGCSVCARSELSLSRCAHCNQIVCDSCRQSHIEHVKLDVARLLGQIRRGIPRISECASTLDRKTNLMKERSEAAKAEVTEVMEKYVLELRNRQRVLHTEVDMFYFNEVRTLRGHRENLDVDMASIASFCDTTEAVMARSRANLADDDLVDMKRQCVEYMENIRSYDVGTYQAPRERQLQLYMEENRLLNVIANFVEIVTNPSPATSENRSASSSRDSSPMVTTGTTAITTPSVAIATSDVTTDQALAIVRGSNPLPHTASAPSLLPAPTPRSNNDVDFSYQRRNNVEAGPTPGRSSPLPRRTLQERRNRHLSDTRLSGMMGGTGGSVSASGQGLTTPPPSTSRSAALLNRRANRSLSTGASLYNISQAAAGSGSSRSNQQPASIREEPASRSPVPPRRFERSSTFTREESNTGNNEVDNASRVSSAEPSTRNRPRPGVRFDLNLMGDDNDFSDELLTTVQMPAFNENESTVVSTAMNNYQDKGRAIVRFGKRGNDEMEFTWPRGIAVSRDDQIFIADSSNHRVQVFDSVGRFVKAFGSYGDSEGEFDCLAGICINTFGHIIISDRYNHRIQVHDHHGNFQLEFGEEGVEIGQLLYPWGVATDSMGFIYVCDKENHRVQVFQSNGRFVRSFGSLGHRSGHFENPHYLAISPDNKIYVSDSSNHRIQVFSMYGDFLFTFGSAGTMQGQMRYPKGISIDEQGFVIVADSGNNRIQVFRGDGRFHCMFGTYGAENGQFKGLEGVALLGNGNVVVSDRENHRIQIF